MTPVESGLRNIRAEFIRETTQGDFPSNPAWLRFSDVIRTLGWSPDPQFDAQRGVGAVDPLDLMKGPEDHEFTIGYDLQQAFRSGGNPLDPMDDAFQRDSDGEIQNTHGVVIRAEHATGGVAGGGIRVYTVIRGGVPGNGQLTGDPDSGLPVLAEITYTPEKVRSYRIDQPASSTTLTVKSSSANDTSQTLTLENEGAGTSEAVSLNGTTGVTTLASFADIDAAYLDAECQGNVTIEDGSGNVLMTIYGSDEFDGIEGDRGVPALGSGSHASAIGSAYEKFIGDTLERPSGTDLAENVTSFQFQVDINVEATPRHDTFRRRIHVGTRDVTVSATVFGTTRSHDDIMNSLRSVASDLIWTLTSTTLTAKNAKLTEPGSRDYEEEGAVMQRDNTFTASGDPAIVVA